MTRTELINMLIKMHGFNSYLEIGMQRAANNFDKINAKIKYSVDPDTAAQAHFQMSSDDFFQQFDPKDLDTKGSIDIFFIDGLHHADQVERDIINSMECLSPGGYIVLHDCNPPTEKDQLVPRIHKVWYGDVWRAFVGFRKKYPNYISFCLDHDCGLGVICKVGSYQKIEPGFVSDMPWQEFDKNRKQLLGII